MLFFNNINIPLAIFTVVLRRFIDKFRAAKVEVSFAYTVAGWVLRNPFIKPIICGYLFVAGIRYALKHFRRGNMVTLTRRNLRNHNTIRNRRRNLERKKSWVLNNLASNRDSQEKVLRYVASLTPRPESRRNPDDSPYGSNFDLSSFASNPYYEPRCSMRNNDGNVSSNCSIVSAKHNDILRKQTSNLTCPTECDTPVKPSDSMESFYSRIYGSTCPSELSGMPTSLNTLDDGRRNEKKRRKFKDRALHLRRRNVSREDRSSGSEKVYRKTRSGRIYGGSTSTKLSSR